MVTGGDRQPILGVFGVPTIAEVIEANSIPEPNSGCWVWLRGASDRGYGIWRHRQATHLALESVGIAIPAGMDACHTCDNPWCVNPGHLFVGTRADNMRDAQQKGRLVGYGKREVCKQGHRLSGDNLYVDNRGKRRCHTCMLLWGRKVDAKRRDRKR